MSFYSPELNERKTRAKKNKTKIDQHVANKVYNLRPSSVISENNERGKKEDSGMEQPFPVEEGQSSRHTLPRSPHKSPWGALTWVINLERGKLSEPPFFSPPLGSIGKVAGKKQQFSVKKKENLWVTGWIGRGSKTCWDACMGMRSPPKQVDIECKLAQREEWGVDKLARAPPLPGLPAPYYSLRN